MLKADDFLIREMIVKGVIGPQDVERAKGETQGQDVSVIDHLVSQGVISSRDVAMVRALVCEVPFVDLEHFEIDIRNASLLPKAIAETHEAFPLFALEKGVVVGMSDPLNFRGLDQVRQRLRRNVEAVLCEPDALGKLIARAYRHGFTQASVAEAESDTAVEASIATDPVIATVDDIIATAIDSQASDIHLGPDEMEVHLRYRIDGVLQTKTSPPKSMHAALVRRLKVLAGLDLTQSRKPQDGKFKFPHRGEQFDLRLSIIPTIWGENAVLRILRHASEIKTFDALGMEPSLVRRIESALSKPHGMFLVTGPTGSGKTTTLYTALSRLNSPERNIMTIEDPVEIRLPMVRQTQVSNEVGLTFATALRTMLRQDPDVVLVGEIRDEETAHIGVQAALTGHLVLSTLHTNDAAGAVSRLRDFGVPPFVISSALLGVLAQRLIRKSCSKCRRPDEPTSDELAAFGLSPRDRSRLKIGTGCHECSHSGFRGRVGVYEWLPVTPRIRALIAQDAQPMLIAQAAAEEGMKPLWRDGLEKVLAGLTTLAEVSRIRAEDGAPPGGSLEAAA